MVAVCSLCLLFSLSFRNFKFIFVCQEVGILWSNFWKKKIVDVFFDIPISHNENGIRNIHSLNYELSATENWVGLKGRKKEQREKGGGGLEMKGRKKKQRGKRARGGGLNWKEGRNRSEGKKRRGDGVRVCLLHSFFRSAVRSSIYSRLIEKNCAHDSLIRIFWSGVRGLTRARQIYWSPHNNIRMRRGKKKREKKGEKGKKNVAVVNILHTFAIYNALRLAWCKQLRLSFAAFLHNVLRRRL